MTDQIFTPFVGLPQMHAPQQATQHAAAPVPFDKPLDEAALISNLRLDQRHKLFIPAELKHPDYEYRFCNSLPQNVMKWESLGFRRVTAHELTSLFDHLHGGVSKEGHAHRPLLMARPKAVGEIVRNKLRQMIREQQAALNPKNQMSGALGGSDGNYTTMEESVTKLQLGGLAAGIGKGVTSGSLRGTADPAWLAEMNNRTKS